MGFLLLKVGPWTAAVPGSLGSSFEMQNLRLDWVKISILNLYLFYLNINV
jgi:hypothetical protein